MDLNMRAIGEQMVQLWDHSRVQLGDGPKKLDSMISSGSAKFERI